MAALSLAEAQATVDRTSAALARAIDKVRATNPDLTFSAAVKVQAAEDGNAARTAYGNALTALTLAAGGPTPIGRTTP